MTDNMTPQLTLDPTAAAAEAVPTLTLTRKPRRPPRWRRKRKLSPWRWTKSC